MRLAFLMPTTEQEQTIQGYRERFVEMRRDQLKHLEHLLRSWGIFGRLDGIELTGRAIKRTLRDRP